MTIRNPFAGAKVSRPIIPGMNKNENSVLSGLTARGPGRSHPFHHLPQPLHVRWLLPQDPRSPEITAGMLEGIPLITVLHHSRMDSMDFRALPLDSLFATAEPADEAAKLSSTGPSYDEDTTFFIKGSDPLIECIIPWISRHNQDNQKRQLVARSKDVRDGRDHQHRWFKNPCFCFMKEGQIIGDYHTTVN